MKKTATIKENRTFQRIYKRGRSALTPFLVLYCRPNNLGHNRLGVTVSTKLGGAVVPTRARRRLREVYRLAQPNLKQGYDLVLVARARSVNGPYVRLAAAFDRAFRPRERPSGLPSQQKFQEIASRTRTRRAGR